MYYIVILSAARGGEESVMPDGENGSLDYARDDGGSDATAAGGGERELSE